MSRSPQQDQLDGKNRRAQHPHWLYDSLLHASVTSQIHFDRHAQLRTHTGILTIYDIPRESIGPDDEYFGLGPEPDHSNGMMLDDEGADGRAADGQGHSRPSTAAKSRPNSAHVKSAPPSPAKSAKGAVVSDDKQEVASWTRVCMSLNNHSEIGVRNENKNENKVLPRILNACIVCMWFSLSLSLSLSPSLFLGNSDTRAAEIRRMYVCNRFCGKSLVRWRSVSMTSPIRSCSWPSRRPPSVRSGLTQRKLWYGFQFYVPNLRRERCFVLYLDTF